VPQPTTQLRAPLLVVVFEAKTCDIRIATSTIPFMFMYGLFKGTVNNSDYIMEGRIIGRLMNSELESMWKEAVIARFEGLSIIFLGY
jgi:hypothetical protein